MSTGLDRFFPLPTRMINYRTTSYDYLNELIGKLGPTEVKNRLMRIYRSIDNLEPGRKYDLFLLPQDREEEYVKFACYYIIDMGGIDVCGVRFSNDWRYLERTKEYGRKN